MSYFQDFEISNFFPLTHYICGVNRSLVSNPCSSDSPCGTYIKFRLRSSFGSARRIFGEVDLRLAGLTRSSVVPSRWLVVGIHR